ncbi:catalase [candidate division WOR-3 bacterium]|nr:catalase [candidate division WOR-3 bacterium]
MAEDKKLTTGFGRPVGDDQNSQTVGSPGYTLLSDVHLHDKLSHFNRERIPERVVHAKGAGAHGWFEVTHDVTRYTCAKFLEKVGKKTEVFARFSTVGGEKGSADAERDPRGFAVKFYTEEGNYDMTGNNTPVFFIRDAIKFPDFIHTQKRNPATNTKDPDMFWDFLSLTPESVHQVTILFSDRGTPLSFRHLNGYAGHAFKWYTAKGDWWWVKLHFKTEQGIRNFTRDEAAAMISKDPDHATRDLFESIRQGEFPAWKVFIQAMPPADAGKYRFDPFDVTKVLPHGDYPLIPVGRMVLDRNPENYFAEVEQAAFSPGNIVPGMALSPDKMLQARAVFYHDAHLHRLGPNYHLLPVNAPKAAMASYQRDGAMRTDDNSGGGPNYWPNSFGGPAPDPRANEPEVEVSATVGRRPYPKTEDDFVQPGNLYRKVMDDEARAHLVGNIVSHLGGAQERIQYRQAALFHKADKEYGTRIAAGLKLDQKKVERLAAMTQEERVEATK